MINYSIISHLSIHLSIAIYLTQYLSNIYQSSISPVLAVIYHLLVSLSLSLYLYLLSIYYLLIICPVVSIFYHLSSLSMSFSLYLSLCDYLFIFHLFPFICLSIWSQMGMKYGRDRTLGFLTYTQRIILNCYFGYSFKMNLQGKIAQGQKLSFGASLEKKNVRKVGRMNITQRGQDKYKNDVT